MLLCMYKKSDNESDISKKVYVKTETLTKLFAYKYKNRCKNLDEVIQDLLKKVDRNSSK